MNHYTTVAQLIRYLEAHRLEGPDLRELAGAAGCSVWHLQRLFSEWAGISPKRFLQCLTLGHARACLERGMSVLDASLEAGLSGPGRLHDLCVRLEAASPGEMKAGGAGWTLRAGFAPCPFGLCLLAEGPRGICHLSLQDVGGEAPGWEGLRERWFGARVERADAWAEEVSRHIFRRAGRGEGSGPRLRAFVQGSAFQVRVWQALLKVPPGVLVSYGKLAERAGAPCAARAAGSAVGANPLAYLIPCHRVIRETGVLGHYRWGWERKRAMLAWESAGDGS